MPDLPGAILMLTLLADATIFLFVGYYFYRIRSKEIEMDVREGKFDRDYHAVVDAALAKERKIIEDATAAGGEIIAKAKEINTKVTEEIAKTLEQMVAESTQEAQKIAKRITEEYQRTLEKLAKAAAEEFDKANRELRAGGKAQLAAEIEAYRKMKMDEIDKKATAMVQKAAEAIFNKSLPIDDHEALVLDALEKAKKEGVVA